MNEKRRTEPHRETPPVPDSKPAGDSNGKGCPPPGTRTGKPDPHALATAKKVQETVSPDTVILFGSRARGDYHAGSDMDLLLVGNASALGEAERVARQYMKENPPETEVEVVRINREEFARAWRAKQHVAGQAMHYGVVMSGERLDHSTEYENWYPEH